MKKENFQGTFEEITIANTKVYLIFTRAGNYRGGKTYDKEKKFTLVSGKVELTTLEDERDITREYFPGSIITIPAGVANIFYFREDSEMLEWFDKDAKSEYFERYKRIKDSFENEVSKIL